MAAPFTQSGNFVDPVSGNVDPRTGIFTSTITLGKLVGNNLRGPELPLSISYQPFVEDNYGLGRGWSFGWTAYDRADATLSVSTGESYKIAQGLRETIKQQKLKTVLFSKFTTGEYKITHTTGDVEVLGANFDDNWVPSALYTPIGDGLNLNWSLGENLLSSITSKDNRKLLSAVYDEGSGAELIIWPDSDESFSIIARIEDEKLTSITIEDFVWQFFYDDGLETELWPLKKIIHPTGLSEEVIYVPNVQHFPDVAGAPTTPLPAVQKYIKDPQAGQPVEERHYSFSDKNYLGFDGDFASYSNDEDNLYNCPMSDYRYSSTESVITNGQEIIRTKRTYDMFHLTRQELTSNGDYQCEKLIDYGAIEGLVFADQSDYFQQPSRQTTTHIRPDGQGGYKKYSETVRMNYNTDGKRKNKLENNGAVTEWDYYPLNGNGFLCPPAPTGVGAFVKSEVVTYPAQEGWPAQIYKKSTSIHESMLVVRQATLTTQSLMRSYLPKRRIMLMIKKI